MTTKEILEKANSVKKTIGTAGTDQKRKALKSMADCLLEAAEQILEANALDLKEAKGAISEVMLDRLMLNRNRIEGMAEGIRAVAALEDPCGKLLSREIRPNGLELRKISVPMGVIAIIYESRPNVTSDAAALALMAGSACVLRSGKEAHRSAAAITAALQQGLERAGLPEETVQLVEDVKRTSAEELMEARGFVDLLIPRGGKGLIRACVDNAKVPVLETGTGICHIYIDRDADPDMALSVLVNAKCSRPSVCNAAEVCLVHEAIAPQFLPALYNKMVKEHLEKGLRPVQLRLDEKALTMLKASAGDIRRGCTEGNTVSAEAWILPAGPLDFDTEFLDLILAVKVVGSVQEAAAHIDRHSTGHSEAIITRNEETAACFASVIDSAAVYVNASTRFTDGGEFGLGCEMGISTQKLHARGPLGLKELCSYKYVINGTGQIR